MNEDVHDRPLAAPNTPSTTRSDGGSGAPADEFALGAPIDTLVGDRLCVRCHHNLFGQPIFRESRYGLVLSRCPECGGFTPLLEYPTLGRWTRRLGAITAAAVLALLLFGALSSAGIMALLAYGTGELSTTTVQTAVQKSMNETGSGSSWWSAGPEVAAWTSKTGGVAAVVRELGGWPRCISIDVIYSASALAIVAFMLGVVISVALFAQRGIRLALLAVVPSLIAALYLAPWAVDVAVGDGARGYAPVQAELSRLVTLPTTIATWALLVVPLPIVGALLGRRIARLTVRCLLPPRYRPFLSFLWICDGLRPPSGARTHAP